MELSEEDRKAFNNQADRVLDALEGDFHVVSRENKNRSVLVVLSSGGNMAEFKVIPRHRFLVRSFATGDREVFHRRQDTVALLELILFN